MMSLPDTALTQAASPAGMAKDSAEVTHTSEAFLQTSLSGDLGHAAPVASGGISPQQADLAPTTGEC